MPAHVALRAAAILLVLATGCAGDPEPGSGGDPSPSPSVSASAAAAPAEVVAAFQAADQAQADAFATAEVTIRAGRSTNNLAASQAGGRAARDALFALDASLRRITFPADVAPVANRLLGALGEAIAAFDAQNTAPDQAAFLAADARTGPAVVAARTAIADLRTALGLPAAPPAPAAPSASAAPKYVTTQQPLARAYVKGSTITDATAWRDDLLTVGRTNVDPAATYEKTRSYSYGIVEAWVGAFPLLKETGVIGSSLEAESSGASGFTATNADSKNPTSASNPVMLAFAVKDASGACAAGVLYGQDAPRTPKALTLAAGAKCTGAAAADAARKAGFS